jgi:hypothetical protein
LASNTAVDTIKLFPWWHWFLSPKGVGETWDLPYLVLRSRMRGNVPLCPPCLFMACTGTTFLYFTFEDDNHSPACILCLKGKPCVISRWQQKLNKADS